jgi:hypothetical protein
MLTEPKSLAPEPYFSASLGLLFHVAIYVRARTAVPESTTEEHIREIHQLMNAIHNIRVLTALWKVVYRGEHA